MKDQRPEDPSLRRAMSAWRAEVEIPPDFRGAVWRRIRRREEHRADGWLRLGDAVNQLLGDFRLAAVVPALAMAIGFLLGRFHDRPTSADSERFYQLAYVDSLDPYVLASRHREGP